ncbi:MAG TPA: metal-dependent hydrolase [Pyrinomonadaceae bacterium]
MDNLTHSLVGLAAAKAGLERQSPYAAFVCVVAANQPDVDIVALARGPAFYLQHHRGITHSIVGVLALAVALPLLFYAAERLWARARGRDSRARLKGLLVCSLLLSASHPLLDWTNSYGVRPLLPWDGRWIYGDLLFVIDPWVWLVLGGACFLLAESRRRAAGWVLLALAATLLFSLVVWQSNAGPLGGRGVPPGALVLWCAGMAAFAVLRWKGAGARPGWNVAASALLFFVFYCSFLSIMQLNARTEAQLAASGLAHQTGERVLRVAAMPVLADPFTWRCLAENERSTSRFDIGLFRTRPEEVRFFTRYERPAGEDEELVRRASEGEDARVLLDFARFPVARVRRAGAAGWVVQFADLRFTEPGARARPGGFALDVPTVSPAGR